MPSVGIRELKINLSRYVESVSQGDEVLITKHGRVVARLVSVQKRSPRLKDELATLAAEGLIRLPAERPGKRQRRLLRIMGLPMSEMVIEDRR
ncbi:type II toxin-antitoxin system prevent-host-death family antitoxin [Candidatus Fermentibacteria bacterium]|nr:type II toxin-antitoxin system prevent-host-death family antitoxin [Candidatus Fermentibacteria bacterium]